MSTRRFLSLHPAIDNHVLITGDELHHLKSVNRAKHGDKIEVINGKGTLYFGCIQSLKNHEAIIKISREEKQDKPPATITIAPSLTKKKAMNALVEKLTEMGVDEIRPVIFERTDEKFSPALLSKWKRIAMQSLKVNKKLWPTQVFPPVCLRELTDSTKNTVLRILLHVDGEAYRPISICEPVISVIGPPGDFVPKERKHLLENGFIQIKINDGILKTETATISIAAILSCIKTEKHRQACHENLLDGPVKTSDNK